MDCQAAKQRRQSFSLGLVLWCDCGGLIWISYCQLHHILYSFEVPPRHHWSRNFLQDFGESKDFLSIPYEVKVIDLIISPNSTILDYPDSEINCSCLLKKMN